MVVIRHFVNRAQGYAAQGNTDSAPVRVEPVAPRCRVTATVYHMQALQEAQLSPMDRAMRRVS